MAGKAQLMWICMDCGEETLKWGGRCLTCGAWNTLKEITIRSEKRSTRARDLGRPEVYGLSHDDHNPRPAAVPTQLSEVDRVLGGGIFPASIALFSGEPGIGKSTLLLQIAQGVAAAGSVLYVTGEESVDQIRGRAHRLHVTAPSIRLVTTTDLAQILDILETERPTLAIIDSIQTLVDDTYPAAAGSVVQVRETALALQRWTKSGSTSLILVGHVTKEGTVAGPRTLEHLVDIVVTLEGERTTELRLIRTQKNRFGPTDEVGILAMTTAGLSPVDNPSARFLEERAEGVPGSVVTVVLEGTRPLLLEIQALTRPMAGVYPKRVASGFDLPRLDLLLAVLETRAGLRLDRVDVFVNVSGGLKIREPAVDAAVAVAVASALTKTALDPEVVIFGELGLAGEIRPVMAEKRRAEEAKRLGYTTLLSAKSLAELLRKAGLTIRSPDPYTRTSSGTDPTKRVENLA
jgi:DNA repair protein RadA/Sms